MRVVFGLRAKLWENRRHIGLVKLIEQYDETPHLETFARYEVEVRYVNSDFIKASFQDKTKAMAFLRIHQLSIDL